MPMPQEYAHACDTFDRFLVEARDALDLATRNQTYTVVQAVLVTFRKRLTADQVLLFADQLPVVLRAIFVSGWHAGDTTAAFGDRTDLTKEVQGLRRHHNFAPDNSIDVVTRVLRRYVDESRFDKVLMSISSDACLYWKPAL
ncbi:MAG: DUF2267 domain-containing protein [Stappiaceae bacterium]